MTSSQFDSGSTSKTLNLFLLGFNERPDFKTMILPSFQMMEFPVHVDTRIEFWGRFPNLRVQSCVWNLVVRFKSTSLL